MKEFRFFLLLFLLAEVNPSQAQWHYKGQTGIEINGNKSDVGYKFDGAYSQYLGGKIYFKTGLFYEYGRPYQTTYKNYGLDGLVFYSALNINYYFFINVGGGITANYDNILGLSRSQKAL